MHYINYGQLINGQLATGNKLNKIEQQTLQLSAVAAAAGAWGALEIQMNCTFHGHKEDMDTYVL